MDRRPSNSQTRSRGSTICAPPILALLSEQFGCAPVTAPRRRPRHHAPFRTSPRCTETAGACYLVLQSANYHESNGLEWWRNICGNVSDIAQPSVEFAHQIKFDSHLHAT
eukprot:gene456-biopygen17